MVREKTSRFLAEHSPADDRPVAREVLADQYARKITRSGLFADPMYFCGPALRNLVLAPVLQMTWRSTIILMLWNWPLLILSVAGFCSCCFRQKKAFRAAFPVTIVFCYMLSVHAVLWPQARYIMPALLPFSAFAGLSIAEIIRKANSRKEQAHRTES